MLDQSHMVKLLMKAKVTTIKIDLFPMTAWICLSRDGKAFILDVLIT